MDKEIDSKVIGTLKQHNQFSDWWLSSEISVPFFDGKMMPITFAGFEPANDQSFISEADHALESFLKFSIQDRNKISDLVYKNCMDFLEMIEPDEADEPLRQIKDKNDIWNFVYPTEIYAERRLKQDKNIYIIVACECAWEQEHGLQLVFRQGKKLTRISDQDGHLTEADAYGKPDHEDELLSKF